MGVNHLPPAPSGDGGSQGAAPSPGCPGRGRGKQPGGPRPTPEGGRGTRHLHSPSASPVGSPPLDRGAEGVALAPLLLNVFAEGQPFPVVIGSV